LLYLVVKSVHMASVAISFGLFLLRGAFMIADSRRLHAPLFRISPHIIDTVLLGSAIWLAVLLRQYPFVQSWLTVKVVLLGVYIVLGSYALKRGRTKTRRVLYFIAAALTFLFIVSVARSHNPLGLLAPVLA